MTVPPTSKGRGFNITSGGPATPPPAYDRAPTYSDLHWDRDVMVPMRDGVKLCIDIYRPEAEGKFPALLAFAPHNKDYQTPEIPSDLPERELVRGWLKASHRALDPRRSKPWKPWHKLTREAQQPVVPGEVTEYNIEILATANLFKAGHRICVEITSADLPTGVAGFTNVEYIPYHVCSAKTTVHRIYHNARYPSHLLLPVIPLEEGR